MLSPRLQRRFGHWFGARSVPARGRLYIKPACGLCDEALSLLEPLEQRGQLTLELVDIETHPDLFRRFCFSIPVLEIDGGPTLEWPFDRRAVQRAL